MGALAFDSSLYGDEPAGKASRGFGDELSAVLFRAAKKGLGLARATTTAVQPAFDQDSGVIISFSDEEFYPHKLTLKRDAAKVFSAHFGDYAGERLSMLFACKAGWDGADAKALDLASVATALGFIRKFDLRGQDVGVFMSPDGQLVLNWNVAAGIFEVTFGDGSLSVFVEGMEDGETYPLAAPSLKEVVQLPG